MFPAVAKTGLAPKNILLATDFSETSQNALPLATALARHYQSTLVLANVLEEVPITSVPMDALPPQIEGERAIAEKRMVELLNSELFHDLKTNVEITPGFIWPVLAKMVEDRKIDLVILGTHGRGPIRRLLLGSVAEEICRHAPCPVITVGPHVKPATEIERIEKVLFATDFSDGSIHALYYALAFAEEHDARLILLHVVHAPTMPTSATDEMIAASDEKLRSLITPESQPAKRPIFVTLLGPPANQILALANREKVNLIVMGMHKPGAFASHWPFEVTGQIIARALCPVLSVRS
jgi:nucleotide-binding universal stress UspA family protein